jgi:hypothetical protein
MADFCVKFCLQHKGEHSIIAGMNWSANGHAGSDTPVVTRRNALLGAASAVSAMSQSLIFPDSALAACEAPL